MKSITIINITLVTIVHVLLVVNAQNVVDSPLVNEVETKKALFYNRKPDGGDKIKVVFLRVPSDEPGAKRTRRHSPSYFRMPSYGQPSLNPTGPPPGLFSPGTPYNFRPGPPQKRRRYMKSKPKYRPKPLRPVQPKTPCPYKQIAEELAAEAEQQRHYHDYIPQPPPPPPPTPPPTTTTTTTTTPAPSTSPPPPVYIQSPGVPQSPQIVYQSVDQMMAMQNQQSQYYQYETLPQDFLQSQAAQSDSTAPQFLVDQNGMILQQQPPPIQNSQQIQTIALSSPQQQFIYKSDMSSPETFQRGLPSPLMQISQQTQQQQQNLFSDQLQMLSRLPGGMGTQMILERSPQSLQQQLALAAGRSATGYPQQQQQQLILLDNSQLNSQVPQTQTLILPNGQVVQTQQQPQPQQSLVLLSPQPPPGGPLSLFQQQSNRLNRPSPLGLGHPSLPLFSDLGGYVSEPQPLVIGGGGDILRQRNRSKLAPHLPLLLPPQEEDEDEEEPLQPLVIRPRKKTRRPHSTREKEKKRFVIIPRKELEQMKHNKKMAQYSKNLPPPPEVIHIPYHETQQEDDDDEEYEEETSQSQESSFDFNAPLTFQGSQQPLKVEESKSHSGNESVDTAPVASSNDSENSSTKAEDKK